MSKAGNKKLRAEVTVYPRREILDPQGKAIGQALSRLGFSEVCEVRAGKTFAVELEASDREEASRRLEEMCSKLLANPIVEDYAFSLQEVEG